MSDQEKDFKDISQAIMRVYHEKMHDYLNSKPSGSLTDADVVIMIMNLTMAVSTNIYYSAKQILPTTPLDFDFMKAKLSNSLIDSFEKIKDYNPKERMLPLTVEQIKDIREKGFAIITMPDGSERKVTQDEILVKKEDADKLLNEAKTAPSTPKIIIPNNFVVPGR
jgi:hypothetical protein